MKKVGYERMSKSALIEIIRVKDEQLKGKNQIIQAGTEIIERREKEILQAAYGIIKKEKDKVNQELQKEIRRREHAEKAADLYKQAFEELLKASE